jgi:hypothetical protein
MGALEPLEGHPYDELSTARVAGFLPSSRRPVPPYSTVASTIGFRFLQWICSQRTALTTREFPDLC